MLTTLAAALFTIPASSAPPSAADVEFFESKVRPVLVERCQGCHDSKKQKGDLRLDSRSAMIKGNDLGPVIVPGEPDRSRMIQAIRHQGEIKMPPQGKLPAEQIEALAQWVRTGAAWPETPSSSSNVVKNPDAARQHWAFQPVRNPTLATVKNAAWCENGIDRFILAALETRGVAPSVPADPRALLRRVTFDLTGLPPTAEELDAFSADPSPEAYSRAVERLLASTQYGERWGRFWLDVARYADSKGYVFTEERRFPFSYTYRDYVIRAFNADLPYDRFILEQLAADQVQQGEDKRPLAAMGFLTLGRRFLNNVHDIIDDRIDVTMRGLQGLTVGCARCHDHKYDPIPTQDYYSLHGIFAASTEPTDLPVLGERGTEAFELELTRVRAEKEKFEKENAAELKMGNRKLRDQVKALQKKVDEHLVTHPGSPPRGMVLVDVAKPGPARVLRRGNPGMPGDLVPRQFPRAIAGDSREPFTVGSGRLELAQAIASPKNPLTARVMVNRVWAWHFGSGLVKSTSDFGVRSDPPSHPELLDWLAHQFMAGGWSVKNLHRLIVMSSTYRQSSQDRTELASVDPENRLLSRMSRRRLEFEALRDSLLQVAGNLDERLGGAAVEMYKFGSPRRSVYGFIDRQNLPGLLRTFDVASPDAHAPQRFETTVPQQALFLMNSPFMLQQAEALARRTDHPDSHQRITQLYRRALGRSPTSSEIGLAVEFVRSAGPGAWTHFAQALLASNEFIFVD